MQLQAISIVDTFRHAFDFRRVASYIAISVATVCITRGHSSAVYSDLN